MPGARAGEAVRGRGALLGERRERAGEDRLGDAGERHAELERVLRGPAARALLLRCVEDHVDERPARLLVGLGQDARGDLDEEGLEL